MLGFGCMLLRNSIIITFKYDCVVRLQIIGKKKSLWHKGESDIIPITGKTKRDDAECSTGIKVIHLSYSDQNISTSNI